MSLSGNIASFGWEELLSLLKDNARCGTLTIENCDSFESDVDHRVKKAPVDRLEIFFQGGLIVVPIPTHANLGKSRSRDCKLANRALSKALSWRFARFTFKAGEVPAGFMARRAICLKPKRLVEAVELLRYRRTVKPSADSQALSRKRLKGDVGSVGLTTLVRCLKRHRRTGTLQVVCGEQHLAIYLKDGSAHTGSASEDQDPSVRHDILAACGWTDAKFRFLPGVLPSSMSDVAPVGGKTERIVMSALEALEAEAEPVKSAPRRTSRRRRSRVRSRRLQRAGRRF